MMEIDNNIMKNLLESPRKPEIPSFRSENSVMNLGQDKVISLKNSINEIEKLIEERKKLSLNFLKEGDEIKLEISNFILENENSPKLIGDKDSVIEKNSLRNKKVEISELQLKEKIDCWKDISLLKKELRENEKELTEKESRLKELNEILKDD
jgi:hypothetical protein